jgi:hypothetical protein
VRPFVSAGATFVHSTDLLTGNGGRFTTRTSLPGWELGAGAEIKAGDHWKIRPELRWVMTRADQSFHPGSLEPPLATPRAGVTAIWSPG